jgi:hypothetical protein
MRAALARHALWSVGLCGRGHEGLQLMRISLGGRTDISLRHNLDSSSLEVAWVSVAALTTRSFRHRRPWRLCLEWRSDTAFGPQHPQ